MRGKNFVAYLRCGVLNLSNSVSYDASVSNSRCVVCATELFLDS